MYTYVPSYIRSMYTSMYVRRYTCVCIATMMYKEYRQLDICQVPT